MKTVSANLQTTLGAQVATLATLWKLTLTDSTVIGFTDHDKDIVFESVTYKSAAGYTPSAVASAAGLNVDELEVQGILAAAGITAASIAAGNLDHAEVRLMLVDWSNLADGALKLRRGWVGEVSRGRLDFRGEVRGLAQRLQQVVGEFYSPLCRAELGDARCKVTLASFTVTGTVTGVTSARVFADSARTEADQWFRYGKLTWTSGNNSGRSEDVKSYLLSGGAFELVRAMPQAVQVGDGYSVYAGCDKAHATCKTKFNNIVNRRAEDFVPTREQAFAYGSH